MLVTSLPGSALRGNPEVTAAAGVLAELQPWLARQVAQVQRRRGDGRARAGDAQPAGRQDGPVGRAPDNAAQKNRELSILLPGQVRDVDVSAPGTVVTK